MLFFFFYIINYCYLLLFIYYYVRTNFVHRYNYNRVTTEKNITFIIDTLEKDINNETSLNDYLLTLGPRFWAKHL